MAAGLGARMSVSGEYLPKAIRTLNEKPLILHSIESFHALRAAEILSPQDLIFVFRSSDLNDFAIRHMLEQKLGFEPTIIEISELTNGPAESAYLAIQEGLDLKKIHLEEAILINDCDHMFDGRNLLRAAEKLNSSMSEQVVLFETSKEPQDLSWSFIRRNSDHSIVGVSEKPDNLSLNGIQPDFGLVGVYGFGSAEFFLRLFNKLNIETVRNNEIYISNLVDNYVKTNPNAKIEVVRLKQFISTGTLEKLNLAESKKAQLRFKEAGSIFIDFDGTIAKHDVGGALGSGRYSEEIKFLNTHTVDEINKLWTDGFRIVITTARAETHRKKFLELLEKKGIQFDYVIMGLSGGPRFLVNDQKPSMPGFLTAIQVNVARNTDHLSKLSGIIQEFSQESLIKIFSGESGEITTLIQVGDSEFIRKTSQPTQNSRDIIEYQATWYKVVRELIPEMIPKVVQTSTGRFDAVHSFDTVFIPDLRPLGSHLRTLKSNDQDKLLVEFVNGLNTIYKTFEVPTNENLTYLMQVFIEKAIEGIKRGFKVLHHDPNSKYLNCTKNGKPLPDILEDLEGLTRNSKLVSILTNSRDIKTLIHGDPTLSNIVCNSRANIYLLDPIGTRVLPGFDFQSSGLGRTNPIFDFSRIQLSLLDEYERWANDIRIMNSGPRSFEIEFVRDSNFEEMFRKLDAYWPGEYKYENPVIRQFVYLITLCRIFPYKSVEKIKEAYFIYSLIIENYNLLLNLLNNE